MERPSSKRSRDERDSTRDHRERDHRDREHKHHRSRGGDGDEKSRHHRSDRDSKLEHSDEPRDHKSRRDDDREGSREREAKADKRERSKSREPRGRNEREDSVERKHKRKDRGDGEDLADGGEKRSRVSDDRKERRRFEDDGKDHSGNQRRERRRFGDKVKEEDYVAEDAKPVNMGELKVKKEGSATNGSGSGDNGASLELLSVASRSVPESSLATDHPLPTKVSSISTTHENKGVSITRSHEVPGKSSTDGPSSAAGKTGNLSLDALAKAKKALQMQKELKEKLKKIPQLNKNASTSSVGSPHLGHKAPPSAGLTARTDGAGFTSSTTASGSVNLSSGNMAAPTGLSGIPNIEAVKRAQELAARMGFRQDPEFAPLINLFPGQVATTDVTIPQKPTKAPVLRLDALGREIDEHGNVVNVAKPSNLSTLKVNINKQKKDAFQILKPELDMDPESNPFFDPKMGINKTKLLRPKRMTFQFVEEGKWSKEAENMKLKSQFGEAQAKEFRVKQAQLAKAKAAPDINPNLIEVSERVITSKEKPKDPIPETEWWDVPLLLSGTYEDITEGMAPKDKLKMEKITIYVEHPRPIEPPAEPALPPPQPLKLTKKEQKKLRTQRRLAREKDRQEMIRQGLIEPPKPKVKMSNLMKVLGAEATQDPTKLEKQIQMAAAEREQAHVDRNIARKLTPAERREKKERKLFDDSNTLETMVSVYKINDLSHPQTRFKVDVNAQENRLTGCTVIADGISVVVVEGGIKSIKRYGKLMLKRINWASAVNDEDEDGDDEEKPVNKCVLVWQGSIAKPSFNRFFVHECRTEAAAKKVFSDAGVAHYWDLAVNFADDQF